MFGMKSVVDLGGSGDVWESRKVRDAQNISLYSIIIYMIVSYTYLYIYILYTGQFASNLQSLVRITDCALTVHCFWG